MKKYIIFGLFCALFFSAVTSANAARTLKADLQAISIPEGTVLKMELLEPVSTKTVGLGDEFSAMLKSDKVVNGQVALPAGSVIRGTIDRITPPKRLSKSAIMYLKFDHVVTPTGRQIPLNAGLYNYAELTLDGGIYQNGNYGYAIQHNWEVSKNILSKSINWGKGTGNNLQYVCVPLGAVGGAIGGAGYYVGDSVADLFRKGNDVNLKQGKEIQVMLTHPLDIPLH